MCNHLLRGGLALVALAGLVAAAHAAPFTATGQVDRSSEVVHGNIVTGKIVGGQATQLGAWTGSFRNRFTNVVEGSIRMVAASGEILDVALVLTFDRQAGVYVGPFNIVAGTGRFAQATGGGTLIAVPQTNAGVVLKFDGAISY